MFGKKKEIQPKSYDKVNKIPILKCSVCTGEKVAGFKDINTNNFEDVMLIKGKEDLEEFAAMYGLNADQIKKEY